MKLYNPVLQNKGDIKDARKNIASAEQNPPTHKAWQKENLESMVVCTPSHCIDHKKCCDTRDTNTLITNRLKDVQNEKDNRIYCIINNNTTKNRNKASSLTEVRMLQHYSQNHLHTPACTQSCPWYWWWFWIVALEASTGPSTAGSSRVKWGTPNPNTVCRAQAVDNSRRPVLSRPE